MTDQQHPITPPEALVEQCEIEYWGEPGRRKNLYRHLSLHIATQFARWGYEQRGADNEEKLQKVRDEELEACCEWLSTQGYWVTADALRAALRPKPKSQAEEALETITEMANCMASGFVPKRSDLETIRTALERLRELEAQ